MTESACAPGAHDRGGTPASDEGDTVDQTVVTMLVGAVALLALGVAAWRWGWLHGPLIVILAAVAATASVVTVFFIYGFFAWKAQGGGMMLFFVLPAAVLAWVAFGVLGVVWRSRSSPHAFDGSALQHVARRLLRKPRGRPDP